MLVMFYKQVHVTDIVKSNGFPVALSYSGFELTKTSHISNRFRNQLPLKRELDSGTPRFCWS